MFINVRKDNTIELTAVGLSERALLRRMADGVHVQAFDDSKLHANWLVLAPKLIVEEKSDKLTKEENNDRTNR